MQTSLISTYKPTEGGIRLDIRRHTGLKGLCEKECVGNYPS